MGERKPALADLMRQIEQARKEMDKLRTAFPGCFDEFGRAIVATAHFPRIGVRKTDRSPQ